MTGLDQRQATTTTGWDLTRSTVSRSWAASDSGLRYAIAEINDTEIYYQLVSVIYRKRRRNMRNSQIMEWITGSA